ncbi:MAG: hypothetical protein ACOCM8_08100 [Acetivibrio ethanolgignens]
MKKWIKLYGVHIGICVVAIVIAFVVNTKTNMERLHAYTVSEPVYTILKEVTSISEENESLTLTGWGFDTNIYNENSRCELILQDTETGEALWPKMEKNPAPVQIAERYTDGEDYSGASFEGSLKKNKMDPDSVYEILIRYTTDYVDENGTGQQYVRTVTTDEFLYQGQMTEYNPKTFVAPEIAGTELEKELEEARLFHYFEEGLWIYYDMPRVYYVAEKSYIDSTKPLWFPCFWQEKNVVEQEEQVLGKGLVTFPITQNERLYETIDDYRIWCSEMPSEKVIQIMTGLYLTGEEKWLLSWTGQIKE